MPPTAIRGLSPRTWSTTQICPRCFVLRETQAAQRTFSSALSHRDDGPVAGTRIVSKVEKNPLLPLLERRGLVNQIAGNRDILDRELRSRQLSIYSGIDPTAQSMHVGHLLPFMVLFWLYRYGHNVVNLIGGGTVRVGDPTGRLQSRDKLAKTERELNHNSIVGQVKRLWDNAIHLNRKYNKGTERSQTPGQRHTLNNAQWLDNLNLMDFLRDLGTGVRLGAMLGRDTVKNKMEKGDGMSFAELTYPLLQAWDWWHMWHTQRIQLQVGGSDQYGNIVAGIDAIKHIAQEAEHGTWVRLYDSSGKVREDMAPMGITTPLLTTASGEKFGKSAGNAVWLDANLTSTFDLYGFLLRTSDTDVERYLNLFTIVPLEEIATLMILHAENPSKRVAQHRLAVEVLELVHGVSVASETQTAHRKMRAPTLATLGMTSDNQDPILSSVGHSPEEESSELTASRRILLPRSLFENKSLETIMFNARLVDHKADARRLIQSGGLYVASVVKHIPADDEVQAERPAGSEGASKLAFRPMKNPRPIEIKAMIENGNLLIMRMGKWKVRIIEVVDDGVYEKKWHEGSVDAPDEWIQARHERS